jgi:proline iminopeptidase
MRPMRVLVPALVALVVQTTVSPAAPARPSGPGTTFTANGTRIWYEVRGESRGMPLIVVNGGPGFDHTYELCSDVWDTLARRRPVVLYDQRGNGRSGALEPGQSCTLNDQVADLDALRAALGRDKVDLLGHSWGGLLVMAYAATHADHVAHLIICDSAAPKLADTEFIFKYVYPEKLERQAQFDTYLALGDSTARAKGLREYMQMLFVSRAKRDAFMAGFDTYHFNPAVNAAISADLANVDLGPVLGNFQMPTLVITGRFDINVAPSTAYRIHKAIPGSHFAVFENSGHLPFFEEPDAFLHVVTPFLDGR